MGGGETLPNFQPLLSLRLTQITRLTGSQVYVARALLASAPCSVCRKAAADNKNGGSLRACLMTPPAVGVTTAQSSCIATKG